MKRLLAAAFLASIPIFACGDKVTVPADKSGACVKGLLTKCGADCVDLQTSLEHCGQCGTACNVQKGEICAQGKCAAACPPASTRCGDLCVDTNHDRLNCGMCGKACTGNEICAKGKCAPTCESAGYSTCAGAMTGVDAGGAVGCVDLSSDDAHCGTCGNVCAGMLACRGGACCAAGQSGCNGACTNLQADKNNCGTCGTVCGGMTPNCVAGACAKCNPAILVLTDSNNSANNTMETVLRNAGFRPTIVSSGFSQYTGMPPASDFGAVFVVAGSLFNSDMPNAGQQAITNAQAMGVGVVLDGFIQYGVSIGARYQTLKSLSLFNYQNSTTYQALTLSGPQPWFAGTTGNFSTANVMLWFASTPTNGGMTAGTANPGNFPAAAFRASPNGRIVHLNVAPNYQNAASQWSNDTNMNQWTLNALRYAASCTN